MVAKVRGAKPSAAKPRPKTAGAAKARSGGYKPAKLGPAHGVGLPPKIALSIAAAAVTLALIGALAAEHRGQALAAQMGAGADGVLARLGLRVANVSVQGATALAQPDILGAAAIPTGQPILSVDLKAVQARVEGVSWVKSARVVRLLPDAIVLVVTQRPILAVWQHDGRTQVIDNDGKPIPGADPASFSELPLVVGEGANDNAATILPLVAARPRLLQRLDALVRVDDRRWDLRMKDGSLIQLPAVAEDSALIQLDQLDQQTRILELGFARIDLRDPELVAVRPKDAAPPGQTVSGGV
jgi:cell division protein FtsQ